MKIHELEVSSVLKNFGQVQVLSNIYLTCKTGEVIGLLGRNGCGKSTLLKIIFGSTDTHEKHIRIDQKVYSKPYQHKDLIAYLPQHGFLPKRMNLKKIAAFFLDDQQAKNNVLQDSRIKNHLDKNITELSGGQRRYFEILLLVNLPAKFLLLDEPFSGIEPLYKEEIKELIHQHKSEKGFILTDHDYRNIIAASSHMILISNGVCRHIDRLEELEEFNYLPQGTLTNKIKPGIGNTPAEQGNSFEADKQTLQDLDLFDPNNPGSLYAIFDHARTKGGKNALDQMLKSPVQQLETLEGRRDTIRYLQEKGISLQIDRKQVDFVEYYITSAIAPARRTYLDAIVSGIKNSYSPSNDYYILKTGIRNTIEFLHFLKELVPALQSRRSPVYLSDLCYRILDLLNRQEVRELLHAHAEEKRMWLKIGHYDFLFRKAIKREILELLDILYELDAFASVAITATNLGLSYPEYLHESDPRIGVQGLFHPAVKHAVANDFEIGCSKNLCFLTGANMSGKSTFLKAFGVAVYLAHVGFPVPALNMRTTIFDGIITTINLSDNINIGYSHFYSEVRRVKETALKIKNGGKMVVIFDELFRGTNVKDASEASLMIIEALAKIQTSLFFISTHIVELAGHLKSHQNIYFRCFDTRLEKGTPVYEYKLAEGVSRESLGLYIVRNEGIVEILEAASQDPGFGSEQRRS